MINHVVVGVLFEVFLLSVLALLLLLSVVVVFNEMKGFFSLAVCCLCIFGHMTMLLHRLLLFVFCGKVPT